MAANAYHGVYRRTRRTPTDHVKALPVPRSPRSSRADAAELLREIRALSDDPEAQLQVALRAMETSPHLDVLRTAIGIVGERRDSAHRDALIRKYEWCEAKPGQHDSGGYVREAIIKALQPIVQPGDLALLQRALTTYQLDGAYELCAGLRAAALIATNEIDPGFAALFAARFLTDPQNSFSGEPATTAIRVLIAQQNLAPVFGLVSWGQANGETIGEGLRNLVDLPPSLLPLLIERYRESEDEQVILGLFDLLLNHPTRDERVEEIMTFFRTTTLMDLYGIIAIQVVASRSGALIEALRDLRATELDRLRQQMLDQALELA